MFQHRSTNCTTLPGSSFKNGARSKYKGVVTSFERKLTKSLYVDRAPFSTKEPALQASTTWKDLIYQTVSRNSTVMAPNKTTITTLNK